MLKRGLPAFSTLFVLILALAANVSPIVAQECDVTRLGGPTRFSDPMNSVDDMRAMFEANRADIETVLGQVGWTGSADDLFAAVAAGEGIAEASYDQGTFFQWMALREKGAVTSNVNKCYAGKQPFDAFTFSVESNGRRWRFAIPKICGNISLLSSEELPPPHRAADLQDLGTVPGQRFLGFDSR